MGAWPGTRPGPPRDACYPRRSHGYGHRSNHPVGSSHGTDARPDPGHHHVNMIRSAVLGLPRCPAGNHGPGPDHGSGIPPGGRSRAGHRARRNRHGRCGHCRGGGRWTHGARRNRHGHRRGGGRRNRHGRCGHRRGGGRRNRHGRCGHRRGGGRRNRHGRCGRCRGGGRWTHGGRRNRHGRCGHRRGGGRRNRYGRCGRCKDGAHRCHYGRRSPGDRILHGRRGCPRVTGRSQSHGHRGRWSLFDSCRGVARRRGGSADCGSPGSRRRRGGLFPGRVYGCHRRPSGHRYWGGWLLGGFRAGNRRLSRNFLVRRDAWAGRAWSSRGCLRRNRCGPRDDLEYQGGRRNGSRRWDGLNADRSDGGRYCPSGRWTYGCHGAHLREPRLRLRSGADGPRKCCRTGASLDHAGRRDEVPPGLAAPPGPDVRRSLGVRCPGIRPRGTALRFWAWLRGARSCRHRSGYPMSPVPQTRLTTSISTT